MFRNMTARQDFQSAQLGLTRIKALHSTRCSWGCDKYGTGINKVDSLTAGSIRHKTLPPLVKNMPPWVNQPFHEDFSPSGFRTIMPHPPTKQSANSVWSIQMRMDVNGLIEPHHSFWAPPESMYDMMSILRAKPGKNNLPMIRFPIAICVFQKQHIIAVGHINAPVPGKYTGWNMEIIRKNRMFVGHSVTGRVFENNQLIRLLLTWFNMRV